MAFDVQAAMLGARCVECRTCPSPLEPIRVDACSSFTYRLIAVPSEPMYILHGPSLSLVRFPVSMGHGQWEHVVHQC